MRRHVIGSSTRPQSCLSQSARLQTCLSSIHNTGTIISAIVVAALPICSIPLFLQWCHPSVVSHCCYSAATQLSYDIVVTVLPHTCDFINVILSKYFSKFSETGCSIKVSVFLRKKDQSTQIYITLTVYCAI